MHRPCIAIFHQVLRGYERSLENLVNNKNWKNNLEYIEGAITVCNKQAIFLKKHGIKKVTTLYHPTPLNVNRWQIKRFSNKLNVIHIGIHCRELELFIYLSENAIANFNYQYIVGKPNSQLAFKQNPNINIRKRLTTKEYNDILTSSLVFMQLSDATANNTILECIARGTPMLVNPIGGVKEYLGKKYPLYYNNKEEVFNKLVKIKQNPKILSNTHEYLLKRKNKFNKNIFLNNLNKITNEWFYDKKFKKNSKKIKRK